MEPLHVQMKHFTVIELIHALNQFPADSPVAVHDGDEAMNFAIAYIEGPTDKGLVVIHI